MWHVLIRFVAGKVRPLIGLRNTAGIVLPVVIAASLFCSLADLTLYLAAGLRFSGPRRRPPRPARIRRFPHGTLRPGQHRSRPHRQQPEHPDRRVDIHHRRTLTVPASDLAYQRPN